MKKMISVFLFMVFMSLIVVCRQCSPLPEDLDSEQTINEDFPEYYHQVISDKYPHTDSEESLVEMMVSYPIFYDPQYQDFNRIVVEYELEQWKAIYEDIIERAKQDIEIDEDLARLNRYIRAIYTVEQDGESLMVTFEVEWYWGTGNVEPQYTRTYLMAEDGMVYSTTTITKRIY